MLRGALRRSATALLEEGTRAIGRACRGAALVAALHAAGAHAEASDCVPWPGEPAPLPNVDATPSVLSRWATLRAQELAETARAVEASSPALAHRLWLHVRCLDPASAAAARGVEATRPVRVFRPDVVSVRSAFERDVEPDAETARLDAPILVVPVRATPPQHVTASPAARPPMPAAPDWKRTDEALRGAETQLRDADFEAALVSAERLRRQLHDAPAADGARSRRVRAEIVAATAEVALGREDAARKSFERALAADPSLHLDPASTSPKVRRAFDAAKNATRGTP